MDKSITEKTLELNICNNLIEVIRKNNLYSKAYWIGISMRLERHIGLDVNLAPGALHSSLLLGLQFKKPLRKEYDYINRDYYYLFKINNNSANDQHIILWLLSQLIHNIAGHKYVFIGYVFPKFIDHGELHSSSPNFLDRSVFIDANAFPIGILDRLPHDIFVYEKTKRVIVHSKEYKINTENILNGKELAKKLIDLKENDLLEIRTLKLRRSAIILKKIISELNGSVKEDVIKYIRIKTDRGWQTTLNSLLV